MCANRIKFDVRLLRVSRFFRLDVDFKNAGRSSLQTHGKTWLRRTEGGDGNGQRTISITAIYNLKGVLCNHHSGIHTMCEQHNRRIRTPGLYSIRRKRNPLNILEAYRKDGHLCARKAHSNHCFPVENAQV